MSSTSTSTSVCSGVFVVVSIVLACIAVHANGQEIIDCTNTETITSIFNEPIDLTFNGTVITTYQNISINEIVSVTNNEFDKLYLSARLEALNSTTATTTTAAATTRPTTTNSNSTATELNVAKKNLIIYTTENFANYSKEQTALRISIKITFACNGERQRTLVFFQPFRVANYFAPEFSKKVYEIILPTPIAASIDLTWFEAISAKDYDLANNRISFRLLNATGLSVSVATRNRTNSDDAKTYFAALILQRTYMQLPPNGTTLQLMAMDNGIPPRNATAIVIVRASNATDTLPAKPQFENSLYIGNVTKELTLEPLSVQLLPAAIVPNVSFTLMGPDRQWFSLNTSNANAVQVLLAAELNKTILRTKRFFQVEIQAESQETMESGNAIVLIELPNIKESFHFEQQLYEGSIDNMGNLSMNNIIFDKFAYTDDIQFTLNGVGNRNFRLQQQNNTFTLLRTSTDFTAAVSKMAYINLQLRASLANINARTNLLIRLPNLSATNVNATTANATSDGQLLVGFEKPLYTGSINADNLLQLEPITLLNYVPASNQLQFSLTGQDHEFFELNIRSNRIALLLVNNNNNSNTGNNAELPIANGNVLLSLTGRNTTTNATIQTFILLEVAKPSAAAPIKFFDKLWYKGNITFKDTNQTLNFEPIPVSSNISANQLAFSLKGAEASHFSITGKLIDNSVHFQLLRPIEDDVIADRVHLLFEFHVRHLQMQLNNSLVVVIEFEKTACNESAANTNQLATTTTATTPTTGTLEFDSKEYIFAVQPNQIGALANITAKSQGGISAVRYTLDIPNEQLQRRLLIDRTTGELRLLSYVSPGAYYFHINAEYSNNSNSMQDRAQAYAKLYVAATLQCNNQTTKVANALIIKHIDEEIMHDNIFNMTADNNCSFEILSVYPADKDYVLINPLTAMLSTVAIDREDPIFANMSVPQIQIKLRLVCGNEQISTTVARIGESGRTRQPRAIDELALVNLNDIPYATDVTFLNLIIVDVNDNAPIFVQPSKNAYVGYPAANISFELFPEYLTKVTALDADVGLNARIAYGMRSNEHFDIDAVTGIVYPKANALVQVETTELVVTATDRAGAADGLTTSIILSVRRLTADYYTLLTYTSNALQGMDRVIAELVNKTGYTVTAMKQATITQSLKEPSDTIRMARADDDTDSVVQKAWVYAFNKNEPITSLELKDKLVAFDPAAIATPLALESYNDVGLLSNQSVPQTVINTTIDNSTGYVVALAVLAALIVAMLGFIYWRLYPEYCCCNQLRPEAPVNSNNPNIDCTIFNASAANAASTCANSYIGTTTKTFKPASEHLPNRTEVDLNDIWCSQNSENRHP